jgi:hypothetical protein
MDGRRRGEVPRRLARAAARFAAWRRTHVPHSRIPKSLWTVAVKLAADFGISHTATTLRLNYYDLKNHVESQEAPAAGSDNSFVQLPASAFPLAGECVIEIENAAGCTMRIQLKGSHCPDLVSLSRTICQVEH